MIGDRYARVMEQISRAAVAASRQPNDVKLVVVTKGQPLPAIEEVVRCGARLLGENYVEEAEAKILALQDKIGVEFHMIGHIQSRKAEAVCQLFQFVHSLDSIKLARRLDRFAGEGGRILPVLLECNVSGEESKYGWRAASQADWEGLIPWVEEITTLPHLDVRGLMTMAPFLPDPEGTRPYFARLRRLRDFLVRKFPRLEWAELSMGMSQDFEIAIQEGATMVRIGTAIMGPRPD